MEAVQDISDKYLLLESYLHGGNELYNREISLAVTSCNRENQYAQDNIDTTSRNHLYRIEIEDIILDGGLVALKSFIDYANSIGLSYQVYPISLNQLSDITTGHIIYHRNLQYKMDAECSLLLRLQSDSKRDNMNIYIIETIFFNKK